MLARHDFLIGEFYEQRANFKASESRLAEVLALYSDTPIAPEDLQVVHTRPIHLLIVDASLDDYQHVHPTPGRRPGEWDFTFRPRYGGSYRIFADFTPVATLICLFSEKIK